MAAQEQSQLLSIAPELRNIIYHEVARDESLALIKANESTEALVDAVKAHSPLARACRQLRDEFGPVLKATTLLTATQYKISLMGFDFERLSQLSEHISKGQVESATQRKCLRLHITLDNTTAAFLMPTHNQLKNSLTQEAPARSPLRFARCFEISGMDFNFRFRVKGMTAEQRSRTITHDQVKATIKRLQALENLYYTSGMLGYWYERNAILECGCDLRRAYREHKKAVRDQRAQSKGFMMAREVGLVETSSDGGDVEE